MARENIYGNIKDNCGVNNTLQPPRATWGQRGGGIQESISICNRDDGKGGVLRSGREVGGGRGEEGEEEVTKKKGGERRGRGGRE